MFCKQGFLYYWAWLKCISVPRVCVRACVQSCCTSRHRSIEVSAPQTDFKDISTPCVQQQTLQHSCHPPTFQHVTVRIKGLQRSWHAHYCQVMYLCALMSGRKKEQGVLWYCKLYICLISLLEQGLPTESDYREANRPAPGSDPTRSHGAKRSPYYQLQFFFPHDFIWPSLQVWGLQWFVKINSGKRSTSPWSAFKWSVWVLQACTRSGFGLNCWPDKTNKPVTDTAWQKPFGFEKC